MGRKKAADLQSSASKNDDALVATLLAVGNGEAFQFQAFNAADGLAVTRYRKLLEQAAKSRIKLANRFLPIGMQLLTSMKVRPTIEFGRRGFTLGYAHDFPTLESALNYGVMLLLDVSKPYGVALSRCGRSTCQRFYLAKRNPKGGPANKHYCSPAHRDEAHDLRENRPIRKSK